MNTTGLNFINSFIWLYSFPSDAKTKYKSDFIFVKCYCRTKSTSIGRYTYVTIVLTLLSVYSTRFLTELFILLLMYDSIKIDYTCLVNKNHLHFYSRTHTYAVLTIFPG